MVGLRYASAAMTAMTNAKDRVLAAFYWHQREADAAAKKARDKRASRHTQEDHEKARALRQHHADTLAWVHNNWGKTC